MSPGRDRVAAVVVALACMLPVAGCTTEEDHASPAAAMDAGSPSATSAADASSGPVQPYRCRDRQVAALRDLFWSMHELEMRRIWPDPRRASNAVAALQRRLVKRTPVVEHSCRGVPSGMRPVTRAANRLHHPMREKALVPLRVAAARWARQLERPEMAVRHRAAVRACRQLSRQLTVWHRSVWRWKGEGKAFWVQLTYDNRTGRQLGAELVGTAVATGMLHPGDAFVPGTGLLRWGGSSADFAQMPPGVSSQHVTPVGPPEVDTDASGTMRIKHSELYVWLGGAGEGSECTVPSRPGP